MNKVILMGRLTRDPEVRYSQGERSMAIARYTLAVDRRGRRSQDGDQGQRVLVSGRIQTGSYVNKDGQKVYTTDVIVDDQEFADSKNQGGDNSGFGGGGYGGGNNRESYQQGTRPAPSSAIGDGFMNIPDGVEDEGLPFN